MDTTVWNNQNFFLLHREKEQEKVNCLGGYRSFAYVGYLQSKIYDTNKHVQ